MCLCNGNCVQVWWCDHFIMAQIERLCHLLGASLGHYWQNQVQLNLKVNSKYFVLHLTLLQSHSLAFLPLRHYQTAASLFSQTIISASAHLSSLWLHCWLCHDYVQLLHLNHISFFSFWFVNLNLEYYLAPCSGQIPLKYLASWGHICGQEAVAVTFPHNAVA